MSVGAFDVMHFPQITEFVEDHAGILSPTDLSDLRQLALTYEKNTTEQAVTILFPNRGGRELADIGLQVFRENGIWQKSSNNGILLLIATEEKKIRIITGYGMGGKVPDLLASEWIESDIRPRVNSGDFAGAVRVFYERLGAVQEKVWSDRIVSAIDPDILSVILWIIGIPICGMIFFFTIGIRVIRKCISLYSFDGKIQQLYYSPQNHTLYHSWSTYYDKYYLLTGEKDHSYTDTPEEASIYSLDDWFEANKNKEVVSAWQLYGMSLIIWIASTVFFLSFFGIIGIFLAFLSVILSPFIGFYVFFLQHPGLRDRISTGESIIYSASAISKPIPQSSSISGWSSWSSSSSGWGGWFSGGWWSSGGGGAGD
jgi:uncharacterized protein